MSQLIASIGEQLREPDGEPDTELAVAAHLMTRLVDPKAYVGDVYSLGYSEALVQIHDFHRQEVGGVPALSLLVATRVKPDESLDVTKEGLITHPSPRSGPRRPTERARGLSGRMERRSV